MEEKEENTFIVHIKYKDDNVASYRLVKDIQYPKGFVALIFADDMSVMLTSTDIIKTMEIIKE